MSKKAREIERKRKLCHICGQFGNAIYVDCNENHCGEVECDQKCLKQMGEPPAEEVDESHQEEPLSTNDDTMAKDKKEKEEKKMKSSYGKPALRRWTKKGWVKDSILTIDGKKYDIEVDGKKVKLSER